MVYPLRVMRRELEDLRHEVDLNKVAKMLGEDLTLFEKITSQVNVNRKIVEEEIEEVEGNAASQDYIFYNEELHKSSTMHPHE